MRRKFGHISLVERGDTREGEREKRGIVDNVALVPAMPGRLMM